MLLIPVDSSHLKSYALMWETLFKPTAELSEQSPD